MALPDFGRKAKDLIPQLAKPPTLSVDTSGAGAEVISPGLQRSQIKAVERPLPDLGAFYLKGDIEELEGTLREEFRALACCSGRAALKASAWILLGLSCNRWNNTRA
jgi:hypothetical protein